MARSTARASLGVLLAGLAGAAVLLAGPAAAQTTGQTSGGALAFNDSVASGTCVATNDSTCSGSGRATGDSTSSGSAVAVDGSVSSGCATAVNDSTASGAPCPATTATTRPATSTGGGATTARPAAATAPAGRSLALTGSDNGELAGAGALALLAGALLVRAGRKDETAPSTQCQVLVRDAGGTCTFSPRVVSIGAGASVVFNGTSPLIEETAAAGTAGRIEVKVSETTFNLSAPLP